MHRLGLILAAATALTAGGAITGAAQALPLVAPDLMRETASRVDAVQNVQVFYWHRHRYCWYDDGWNGPGWYWCSYRWHSGLGWGGGWGWHGWNHHHHHFVEHDHHHHFGEHDRFERHVREHDHFDRRSGREFHEGIRDHRKFRTGPGEHSGTHTEGGIVGGR